MSATANILADDLYERLGVARSATAAEVKRAYQRLLRKYPPERAAEEFKRIREAYETLTDPHARGEYDSQPDPHVRRWIEQALSAMGSGEYELAERYFKQVLIQEPDLAFVRNQLGLCFLYQERPDEAVSQYERLLRSEAPAAYLYGNAGHAFRQAGRLSDAKQAFERAIELAQGEDVSYYIGLASVYVDQELYSQAQKLLEEAIRSDGRIDFEDLQFFTKLLEVHLLERDLSGVRRVLERIQGIIEDEEQARYVAWKLGVLAQQLIELQGFEYAIAVAEAARTLQPDDVDYQALGMAAEYLKHNRLSEAASLVNTYPSFAPEGWLAGLRAPILEYCRENRVLEGLTPISRAPSLRTINTIGFTLYGRRDVDPRTRSYIATLFFVVLFIPIFPVACYRVIQTGEGTWSFLGKVPFSDREKVHVAIALFALAILAVWYAESSSSTYSTSTRTPTTATAPRPAPRARSGSSATTPPRPASTRSGQLEAERSRIRDMESRLKTQEAGISATEAEIQRLKRRIESIEADARAGLSYDRVDYDRLITRHNALVEQYNTGLQAYNALYRDYSAAVDAYNLRVQSGR